MSAFEALCTLDAGRFRLPLLSAVSRLMQKAPLGLMLVDAPGVVRGIAGSELLTGMVELLKIDTVLVLNRQSKPLPLMNELLSLDVLILPVHAHPEACRPWSKDQGAQTNPAMADLPRRHRRDNAQSCRSSLVPKLKLGNPHND